MTTDARPLLPTVKAPITLVVPWSDSAFGKNRTLAFYGKQYAGATNVQYADIGDSGHMVMLDQPQAFQAAVEAFIAK